MIGACFVRSRLLRKQWYLRLIGLGTHSDTCLRQLDEFRAAVVLYASWQWILSEAAISARDCN